MKPFFASMLVALIAVVMTTASTASDPVGSTGTTTDSPAAFSARDEAYVQALSAASEIFVAPCDLYFDPESVKARRPTLSHARCTEVAQLGSRILLRFESSEPPRNMWVSPGELLAARFSLSAGGTAEPVEILGRKVTKERLASLAEREGTAAPDGNVALAERTFRQMMGDARSGGVFLTASDLRNGTPTLALWHPTASGDIAGQQMMRFLPAPASSPPDGERWLVNMNRVLAFPGK